MEVYEHKTDTIAHFGASYTLNGCPALIPSQVRVLELDLTVTEAVTSDRGAKQT